jgi:hypothetical protein
LASATVTSIFGLRGGHRGDAEHSGSNGGRRSGIEARTFHNAHRQKTCEQDKLQRQQGALRAVACFL